jgi:hypothetical protein
MEVLPRQLDAFDTSVIAVEGVGDRLRARHPQGVRRIVQPLSVEGAKPGRTEGDRRFQVALTRRPNARLGQPPPLSEEHSSVSTVDGGSGVARCSRAAC